MCALAYAMSVYTTEQEKVRREQELAEAVARDQDSGLQWEDTHRENNNV